MKLILFILCSLLLTSYGYSQNSITYNKVKYYNGDSTLNDAVIEGVVKNDTNFIIVINGEYSNQYFGVQIARIDKYGNMINIIRINDDSIAFPVYPGNCITKDSNNNVIIVGYKWYRYLGKLEGFIIKLTPNLDTLWTRTLHLPPSLVGGCDRPNNHFTAIDCTPDGGYIVMGNYYKDCIYDFNNKHPYITKYDKNGNLKWTKVYTNLLSAFDIASTNDSGFVFSPENANQDEVCKTDSLGNIEWYANANSLVHMVSFDITVSGNEIISISPYVYYSVGNDLYSFRYGIDITKTNSTNGQIVWNKQYIPMYTVKNPTLHQHHEVKVDNNGNIFIAGTGKAADYDTTSITYKGFLMKLNSNGDSLWTHFYDWGNFWQRHSQFNDFVITDDGGILAGGFWNPPYLNYKQGAWLVKTDSMGNAPGMFTVGLEEKNTLIIKKVKPLLYPNPATNNFNLSFEQSPTKAMQLSIYNSAGQLVKQEQLTAFGNEYRVDIEDLSIGVYFVRLESDGKVVFSSKFIKE